MKMSPHNILSFQPVKKDPILGRSSTVWQNPVLWNVSVINSISRKDIFLCSIKNDRVLKIVLQNWERTILLQYKLKIFQRRKRSIPSDSDGCEYQINGIIRANTDAKQRYINICRKSFISHHKSYQIWVFSKNKGFK